MHDDSGRVDRPPQPRLPRRAQLLGQVLPKVARLGSGADRRSRLLDHPPRRIHRERIVHLAGELVHGREVAKLHGKSLRVGPMAVQEALPHWDLTPFFSAPDSPELEAALEEVAAEILALRKLVDDGALESDFDGVLERLNALLEREHPCTPTSPPRSRSTRGIPSPRRA